MYGAFAGIQKINNFTESKFEELKEGTDARDAWDTAVSCMTTEYKKLENMRDSKDLTNPLRHANNKKNFLMDSRKKLRIEEFNVLKSRLLPSVSL